MPACASRSARAAAPSAQGWSPKSSSSTRLRPQLAADEARYDHYRRRAPGPGARLHCARDPAKQASRRTGQNVATAQQNKIRIRLKAYDSSAIETAAKEIVETATR